MKVWHVTDSARRLSIEKVVHEAELLQLLQPPQAGRDHPADIVVTKSNTFQFAKTTKKYKRAVNSVVAVVVIVVVVRQVENSEMGQPRLRYIWNCAPKVIVWQNETCDVKRSIDYFAVDPEPMSFTRIGRVGGIQGSPPILVCPIIAMHPVEEQFEILDLSNRHSI